MLSYPRISEALGVDGDAGCLYRYVYGAEDIFNPHRHEFYEIFLTISGTVTHFINGIVQKLPEGSLVFIRPDDVHGYLYDTPESKKTSYVNLTFSAETAEGLFQFLSDSFPSKKLLSCDMPPAVTLSGMKKEQLLARISRLNLANWQDKAALKLHMRAILADVFVQFFYDLPDQEQKDMPVWLSALLAEMEQPDHFIAGMDRMVALCGKSREHLARCLKKYCGVTTAEYINELRINYASNLLLRTNAPILGICFTCGFQSASYFYKVFERKYGVSPSEFKRQHKHAM